MVSLREERILQLAPQLPLPKGVQILENWVSGGCSERYMADNSFIATGQI